MSLLQNSNAISAGGYDINNSLRFRASASAYLNRTPGSAGNQQIMTFSFWFKRGDLSTTNTIYNIGVGSSYECGINFQSNGTFRIYDYTVASAYRMQLTTTQVFRDPSAWYHIVVAIDTTQATASNRVKVYVNGVQISAFSTATYPSQNLSLNFNVANVTYIGRYYVSATELLDGYLAEFNFINSQQLTPSSFGETDAVTGSWVAKKYTGTYGTNGFYLKFSDIATTSGSNAGLGKDFSGNTNYWTTNNISVTAGTTYDAMIDSPTLTSETVGNYCVMNPVFTGGATLTNGNLSAQSPSAAYKNSVGTITFPTSGKYYFEVTIVSNNGSGNNQQMGIADASNTYNFVLDCFYSGALIRKGVDGAITTGYGTASNGMVIGIAVDATNGKAYLATNNTWIDSSSPTGGTGGYSMTAGIQYFGFFQGYNSGVSAYNFGQRPFTYTPPTGFVRLNTFNLPNSTILKGNKYMDATTYTGTGVSNVIVNAGQFKPDFVWGKSRSLANSHILSNSVAGVNKFLISNSTAAEGTNAQAYASFNSNGFTLGTDTSLNSSGATNVAWQWQAGQGTTSSNTSGSITSTVSVNATAGFSIVTWTGTGANATVGHGLGVAPAMVIVKRRSGAEAWGVYHRSLGATQAINLELTVAAYTYSIAWNNTAPTSNVFSLGTWAAVNSSGGTFVAYCWAEIAGFSKFGSYTGNSNADGAFVYTGFRPRYVMIKNSGLANNWCIYDTARNTYNVTNSFLVAQGANAEQTGLEIDILSNGFKARTTNDNVNSSSYSYIYMAFAEVPTKFSNAR
jgi:hypothetical protein